MNTKHCLLLTALLLSACSSSSSGESSPSLYGNWMVVNPAGTFGEGLTLNPNGEYASLVLQMTSENSANVELETGSFTIGNGTMTATPEKSSCGSQDPPGTYPYLLTNGALEIGFPTGMISFERNDAPPANNFVIVYGCFHNGVFSAAPLSSVK